MPKRPPTLTGRNVPELRLQLNEALSEICDYIEEIYGIDGKQFKTHNTIDANSKKIVNLLTPTANKDAAPKDYVDGVVNVFKTVSCPAGTNPVADNAGDTLTFLAGSDLVTITGNSATDSVSWNVDFSPDSEALAGDVAMTLANTFYDGPGLTLGVGKWLVVATNTVQSDANVDMFVTSKLWNGTAVGGATESVLPAMGAAVKGIVSHTIHALVTISSGTETWKCSSAATIAAFNILAATPDNAAANATQITAVRVG